MKLNATIPYLGNVCAELVAVVDFSKKSSEGVLVLSQQDWIGAKPRFLIKKRANSHISIILNYVYSPNSIFNYIVMKKLVLIGILQYLILLALSQFSWLHQKISYLIGFLYLIATISFMIIFYMNVSIKNPIMKLVVSILLGILVFCLISISYHLGLIRV